MTSRSDAGDKCVQEQRHCKHPDQDESVSGTRKDNSETTLIYGLFCVDKNHQKDLRKTPCQVTKAWTRHKKGKEGVASFLEQWQASDLQIRCCNGVKL